MPRGNVRFNCLSGSPGIVNQMNRLGVHSISMGHHCRIAVFKRGMARRTDWGWGPPAPSVRRRRRRRSRTWSGWPCAEADCMTLSGRGARGCSWPGAALVLACEARPRGWGAGGRGHRPGAGGDTGHRSDLMTHGSKSWGPMAHEPEDYYIGYLF